MSSVSNEYARNVSLNVTLELTMPTSMSCPWWESPLLDYPFWQLLPTRPVRLWPQEDTKLLRDYAVERALMGRSVQIEEGTSLLGRDL